MDCRTFHKNHAAFVDDVLSAVDMVEAQRHTLECTACARYDTSMRRALLVFRNVPRIEPSPDFRRRLSERLAAARLDPVVYAPPRRIPWSAFAAALIGVIGISSAALVALSRPAQPPIAAVAAATAPTPVAVVAAQDEPVTSALTSSALAASMSSGMPVWPALLMVEQASMHFSNGALFHEASIERE